MESINPIYNINYESVKVLAKEDIKLSLCKAEEILSFSRRSKLQSEIIQKRLLEVLSFSVLKDIILSSLVRVTKINKNKDSCKNLVDFEEATHILNSIPYLEQQKFVIKFIELFDYTKNRQKSFLSKYKNLLLARTSKQSLTKAVLSSMPVIGVTAIYLPTLSVIIFGCFIIYLTDRGYITTNIVEFNPCLEHDNYSKIRINTQCCKKYKQKIDETNFEELIRGVLSAEQASKILRRLNSE